MQDDKDMAIDFSDIPEITDFSKAQKNPFAKKMKKGYSVTINYETPEDVDEDIAIGTIKSLLRQPGLNSIRLNINKFETEEAI